MIKALAHACLVSTDLEKTENFYCGVLGLERHFDFIKEGKKFGFYLKVCDNNFLEFFLNKTPEHIDRQLIKHICLKVESVEDIEKKLQDNGVECWGKKKGKDQSWQIWCKDPDGVQIEFHEYTLKSSQITKEDCIL